MIKKFLVLIVIVFTTNCGFTPIYSNKQNSNFSIEEIDIRGDRKFNNYLKSNLIKYRNVKSERKISLDITTSYKKNTLSKDRTGKIVKYELVVESIFVIKENNQKLIFNQKKVLENMDNKSDERSYENSIIQTFANIITNELVQKLITMK